MQGGTFDGAGQGDEIADVAGGPHRIVGRADRQIGQRGKMPDRTLAETCVGADAGADCGAAKIDYGKRRLLR